MEVWPAPPVIRGTRDRWRGPCERRTGRYPGTAWWARAVTSNCAARPRWSNGCGSRTKASPFAAGAFTCVCMNSASKPRPKEPVRVPKIFSSADRALAARIEGADECDAGEGKVDGQECPSYLLDLVARVF